ncbi:MAG: RNA polymerase sigma factor [Janthinobacterium lividum]
MPDVAGVTGARVADEAYDERRGVEIEDRERPAESPDEVRPGTGRDGGEHHGPARAEPYPGGMAEAIVVGRAQEGDLEAFELVVRRNQGPVLRLAYRMLGDRGEAEDVVQDCLVLVWRKLPSLTDVQAFHRWIHQLATRRCLSVLRTRSRRRRDATAAGELERDLPLDGSADPASVAQHVAQVEGLDALLRRLPDEQRAGSVLRPRRRRTDPLVPVQVVGPGLRTGQSCTRSPPGTQRMSPDGPLATRMRMKSRSESRLR